MYQEIKKKVQGNLLFYLYYGHDGCVNVYCGMLVPLFDVSVIVSSGKKCLEKKWTGHGGYSVETRLVCL